MTKEFNDFIRTLKNMGVFGNFSLACQKYDKCKNIEKIKYMHCSKRDMLNMSFSWNDSKEGSDFWVKVYYQL